MSNSVDSLEVFTEKFHTSLAESFEDAFQRLSLEVQLNRIELYHGCPDVLVAVREGMLLHLSPFHERVFTLRASRDFLRVETGTYYIDVGYFFELYERRKAEGRNVVF